MKLTARQTEALIIIAHQPGLRALDFAEKFWPRSHALQALSNQGHGGACRGKKAWLMAGSYLGKLAKLGLVRSDYVGQRSGTRITYSLTSAGRAAL